MRTCKSIPGSEMKRTFAELADRCVLVLDHAAVAASHFVLRRHIEGGSFR